MCWLRCGLTTRYSLHFLMFQLPVLMCSVEEYCEDCVVVMGNFYGEMVVLWVVGCVEGGCVGLGGRWSRVAAVSLLTSGAGGKISMITSLLSRRNSSGRSCFNFSGIFGILCPSKRKKRSISWQSASRSTVASKQHCVFQLQ